MIDFLNSTLRSIVWVKNASEGGVLEMKPPFQRNPVWTTSQKSFLIDTILRGYPVPELYMQDIVDADGSERHVVVDGQQRIRACLEFIEGQYALAEKETEDWGGLLFEELPPDERKAIFGYKFVVRILPDIPDEEVRQIFKRLNRNVVALNRQELRHSAYWGEFISSMEKIASNEFWVESAVFTPNDFRRMLDVEFISELAIAYLHGLQNKKARLDDWYKLYEEQFERRSEVETIFSKTTGEIDQIVPDLRRSRWRNRSDFYTLFWVFARHANEFPLSRDQRDGAAALLAEFGQSVTALLSKNPNPSVPARGKEATRRIAGYARAVSRAASDFSSRFERAKALDELLEGVFETRITFERSPAVADGSRNQAVDAA